jgi:hypothetical protein
VLTSYDLNNFELVSSAILKSTVTAKGDLIVATANGAVTNVALGNNNYVLTADSATASGVKWAAAASAADPTPTSLMLMGG